MKKYKVYLTLFILIGGSIQFSWDYEGDWAIEFAAGSSVGFETTFSTIGYKEILGDGK